jgi:hypothetical protein
MPTHSENGLSLRWDEPDLTETAPVAGWSRVLVAVSPRHVSNVVEAVCRVDDRAEQVVRGFRLMTNASGTEDIFAIDFPPMPDGARIAYLPRLSCSNRTADPRRMNATWASPIRTPRDTVVQPQPRPDSPPFGFNMDLLARVTVGLERQPISVGETPEGLRIDFPLGEGGTVVGPRLNGTILHSGEDWMLVRPDGIGLSQVRVLIRTADGSIAVGDYGGVVDFGPDGYKALASGAGPEAATVQLVPRYTTSAPALQWLNRCQCLGIGRVTMKTLTVEYDLYSVQSGALRPRSSA